MKGPTGRRLRAYGSACLLLALAASGCASTSELPVARRLQAHADAYVRRPTPTATAETAANGAGKVPGSLVDWLARARAAHPALEAQFFRWKEAVLAVSRSRRWPEPEIGYTAFIGTGMMPVMMQRHQLVLKQTVPWLSRFDHAESAAVRLAESEEQKLFAAVRDVEREVAEAYFGLWKAREEIRLRTEQRAVVSGMLDALQARLGTGRSGLADLQMAQIALVRADDAIAVAGRDEKLAIATMKEATGLFDLLEWPTVEGPEAVFADSRFAALHAAASAGMKGDVGGEGDTGAHHHPRIAALRSRIRAMEAAVEVEKTEALPMFGFEAGFMEMSPGANPGLGTGADIVMLSLMVKIPLWQSSYAESVDAMRAGIEAERSEEKMVLQQITAAVEKALVTVRDAERREELYRRDLVPRTVEAYQAMLGAWTAGMGSVVELMRLQQELIELKLMAVDAAVEGAMARSMLEALVGPPSSQPGPDLTGGTR
jgi:outer membrane protein TolC